MVTYARNAASLMQVLEQFVIGGTHTLEFVAVRVADELDDFRDTSVAQLQCDDKASE